MEGHVQGTHHETFRVAEPDGMSEDHLSVIHRPGPFCQLCHWWGLPKTSLLWVSVLFLMKMMVLKEVMSKTPLTPAILKGQKQEFSVES